MTIDQHNYTFDKVSGTLIMVAGIILLLHNLGILEKWLDTSIIVIAVAMIIYGFFRAGYPRLLFSMFRR